MAVKYTKSNAIFDDSNALFKFLGNPANSDDPEMNVDGSVTPVVFEVVATGGPYYIERINIFVVDGGIGPGKFGGVAALANGLTVQHTDSSNTEKLDFLDGQTITVWADWSSLAGADATVQPAAGDDGAYVRWTLSRASGGTAYCLDEGDKLRITVNDDLSAITKMRAMAQGRQ